jgi:glucokinase
MKNENVSNNQDYCIAVDVGGTKITSALIDRVAQISEKNKVFTEKSGADKSVEQIRGIIKKIIHSAEKDKGNVKAVGIAIPGAVFQKQGIVWAPNIPGWDHLDLHKRLQDKIDVPIIIDSDRSACVLGEQWVGAARKLKNVVFLTVGTGIGAGIISGGRLIRGSDDIAGAVGWFALNLMPKPEYKKMGCFEAEASGDAIGRKALSSLNTGETSVMIEMVNRDLRQLNAVTVIEAAQKKDPIAVKIITSAVKYLAMGVANIVSILNPRMVVLGGGLFQSGDYLLEPIRKKFKNWAQPLAAERVTIELTKLGEDAALFGAGKLAWLKINKVTQ